MSEFSSRIPVSMDAIYTTQNKFFELRVFAIIFVLCVIGWLYTNNAEISLLGFFVIAVILAFIAKTINKVKKEDNQVLSEPLTDWLSVSNNGEILYQIGEAKMIDESPKFLAVNFTEDEIKKSVGYYWRGMENLYILNFRVDSQFKKVPQGTHTLFYYSSRMFLMPFIYNAFEVKNKPQKLITKQKLNAKLFKGKAVLLNICKPLGEKVIKPPFLNCKGQIKGLEEGIELIINFRSVKIKYENAEIFAYFNTFDSLVDCVIIFEGKTYMFKLQHKEVIKYI